MTIDGVLVVLIWVVAFLAIAFAYHVLVKGD